MGLLEETLGSIKPSDTKVMDETRQFWDKLGKPLGSLGRIEEIAIKIAGITGQVHNKIEKKTVVVLASDNGIFEEGIASSPQIFTKILAENTAKGLTGVATLSRYVGGDVHVVDMGIKWDIENPKVINRKMAYGSKNFVREAAMTYEDAKKAVEIGIEIGDDLVKNQAYEILGVGELGIGNTTTSAAVLSALTGLSVDRTCGIGGGLKKEQLAKKKRVVEEGLRLHKPNREDPIDVLSKVGGYDICAMVGVYLSGAKNRVPVVIDGFISQVAALCAIRLNPATKDYILPSHLSREVGANYGFEELGIRPIFDLEMRLGEGSGCPLTFQLVDMALYTQENMGSFLDLNIDSSILLDMRNKKDF